MRPNRPRLYWLGLALLWVLVGCNNANSSTPPASRTARPTPTRTPTPAFTPSTDSQQVPVAGAYQWQVVGDNFDSPVGIAHANDDSGRLFVVEQGGTVMIVQDGQMLATPFLNIASLLTPEVARGGYSERGLLGLTFSPNYQQDSLFYITYVEQSGSLVLARWQTSRENPNLADPNSQTILLSIVYYMDNHNAGHIAFGPDGYLYIAVGDGGGGGDPWRNAQNPATLNGKILRLDVSDSSLNTYKIPPDNPFVASEGYAPEIWALGLRNPWRFSFDRATGDLYIADVGQSNYEEVNFQPAGQGGQNYGWSVYEGNTIFNEQRKIIGGLLTMPVLIYDHGSGCAISGGYVYRGWQLPALRGLYLYGDYCNGRVWYTRPNGTDIWSSGDLAQTERQITAFGEDDYGELYLVDFKGALLKLVAAPANP
jgi:glucose/arabinose dehydrogenase